LDGDDVICLAEPHPTEIDDDNGNGVPDLMVSFSRSVLSNYLVSESLLGEVELTVSVNCNI
jgi:hypothetical protein